MNISVKKKLVIMAGCGLSVALFLSVVFATFSVIDGAGFSRMGGTVAAAVMAFVAALTITEIGVMMYDYLNYLEAKK